MNDNTDNDIYELQEGVDLLFEILDAVSVRAAVSERIARHFPSWVSGIGSAGFDYDKCLDDFGSFSSGLDHLISSLADIREDFEESEDMEILRKCRDLSGSKLRGFLLSLEMTEGEMVIFEYLLARFEMGLKMVEDMECSAESARKTVNGFIELTENVRRGLQPVTDSDIAGISGLRDLDLDCGYFHIKTKSLTRFENIEKEKLSVLQQTENNLRSKLRKTASEICIETANMERLRKIREKIAQLLNEKTEFSDDADPEKQYKIEYEHNILSCMYEMVSRDIEILYIRKTDDETDAINCKYRLEEIRKVLEDANRKEKKTKSKKEESGENAGF